MPQKNYCRLLTPSVDSRGRLAVPWVWGIPTGCCLGAPTHLVFVVSALLGQEKRVLRTWAAAPSLAAPFTHAQQLLLQEPPLLCPASCPRQLGEKEQSLARQPAWAQPQLCCFSPSSSALCSTVLGATSMPSLPTEQDIWWNGFCGELGKHAVLEWLRANVICGTENCVYQEKLPKPASFWREVPGLEGHLQ